MQDFPEKDVSWGSRESISDKLSYREAVKRYLEFIHHTDMSTYTFDFVICGAFNADQKNHARVNAC